MKTILIAEDDPTSRLLLEAILRKLGYDVAATATGQEAWQVMQAENPPLLAILDWMMPGINGVEFCWKICESATLALTYIILLTGKADKEDLADALGAGANL